MKAGDNVICIKDVFDNYSKINKFIKNKKYKIKYIEDTLENNGTINSFYITNERNSTSGFHGREIFDKYFITEKELRNLKLQKINGKY